MMDELRKEFNENCILGGILEESMPWICKKHLYLIKFILLIFILYFLSYNISSLLFGYGLKFNLIDTLSYENEYGLFSVFRTILVILMGNFTFLVLSNYYINRIESVLNEKYSDLMQMYLLFNDLESLNSNFFDFLFDFKNRFKHCIKLVDFVIMQNRLIYERTHLHKKGKKYIDEIIKYNKQDIQELENRMDKNPIFAFYAFIGGLIANYIFTFSMKSIDSYTAFSFQTKLIIFIVATIFIFLVCQVIVKFFYFIRDEVINFYIKRDCEYLKRFNKYLINITLNY